MWALDDVVEELEAFTGESFGFVVEFCEECGGFVCGEEVVDYRAGGVGCDVFGGVEVEGSALFGEGSRVPCCC